MSRTMVLLGAALCAAMLLFESSPCRAAKPTSAELRIERALDSPSQAEYIDTPLSDVVADLKERHAIEIQIDRRALEDVGITTDTPITKDLKGLSLRAMLRLMLRDLDLTFLPWNEVLQITTPEEAENRLTTTVYRVADLMRCRDCGGQRVADAKTLVKVITTTVQPDTWGEVGGPGSIVPVSFGNVGALVVSQRYDVHREIIVLLADLRAIAGCKPSAEGPATATRCTCTPPPPATPPTPAGGMMGGMGMGGMGMGGMGMGGMGGRGTGMF